MRKLVTVLTASALVAIASTSASLPPRPPDGPPDPAEPKPKPPKPPKPKPPEPPPPACTGWPCEVSPYTGFLPPAFEQLRMEKLGCEKPFKHGGGLQRGETGWVGYSCPASVASQFQALPADFSDRCLKKRAGRVYVPVFRASCSIEPSDKAFPQAQQLGCDPPIRYSTGGDSSPVYYGSYCPDTEAVRKATKPSLGFPALYCDGCLDVPAGKIFKVWLRTMGPNCPNGCPSAGAMAM